MMLFLACAGAIPSPTPPARIYALGDLHGDLDNAIATLRLAGLVDGEGHWTGGTSILVQTGDVVDRGPDSKVLLAWLRRLTDEAHAAGGRVEALLGNHEVMNLRGDWRYVSAEDIAAYSGPDARRLAFSPTGEDGAWLRARKTAVMIGETLFVHGGISAAEAAGGVDALNARVRDAIDAAGEASVLGPDGPLWYRGYVNDPETTACPALAEALKALGAARMVVGHTTRRDGQVQARCGGALVVIDIGIADGYGGHLGLLELRDGVDAVAITQAGRTDLSDP